MPTAPTRVTLWFRIFLLFTMVLCTTSCDWLWERKAATKNKELTGSSPVSSLDAFAPEDLAEQKYLSVSYSCEGKEKPSVASMTVLPKPGYELAHEAPWSLTLTPNTTSSQRLQAHSLEKSQVSFAFSAAESSSYLLEAYLCTEGSKSCFFRKIQGKTLCQDSTL